MVCATSKIDVRNLHSPPKFTLKQCSSKVPRHLKDKVNRPLDNLEKYEIISPVNTEQQPKLNTFIIPVTIFAKRESLKILLDERYLHSLIDECNWPIEPMSENFTKKTDTVLPQPI